MPRASDLPRAPAAPGPTAAARGETRRRASARRSGYKPGLDGLRGVAVLAVMLYHAGVGVFPGGFLGVDLFFVVSGYLITGLLLDEHGRRGSISLRDFWWRRARRLLPAVVVLVAVLAVVVRLGWWPGNRGSFRLDALATLGYVANWRFVLADQSYFVRGGPVSLLRHTWSLAIEEQFYVVWPLVVVGLLRVWGRRAVVAGAAAGAAASAAAMTLLAQPHGDPSRAYYGTDTRAQALLIGAVLAGAGPVLRRAPSPSARRAVEVAGGLGAAFTVWWWCTVDGRSPLLYRGGFAVVALATAALVVSAVEVPGGLLGRQLRREPLVAIGRLSYSLYLWHWPVFVLLSHERTGLPRAPLLALRLVVSLAAAVASWTLVEEPLRRGPWLAWRPRPLALSGGVVVAVVLAVVLLGTSVPVAPGHARLTATPAEAVTTTAPVATAPTVPRPPTRVLLVGDSVSITLAVGLAYHGDQYGVKFEDRSLIGCGIARVGPLRDDDKVASVPRNCLDWPRRWQAQVAQVQPDVAAVLVGRWEVLDRKVDGQWTHVGQPVFDSYITQELELAVTVLGAGGARVALLTTPVFKGRERPDGGRYPQDDPARVARFNDLLRAVAARHPGRVEVVDFEAMVTPNATYTPTLGSTVVRDSDGVHITRAGAELLAPQVFGALSAMDPRGPAPHVGS